jgi:hypothetical protein
LTEPSWLLLSKLKLSLRVIKLSLRVIKFHVMKKWEGEWIVHTFLTSALDRGINFTIPRNRATSID